MAKFKIKAWVHYEQGYVPDEPPFKCYPFDMSSGHCVLIGEQTIEVDVPDDFNPLPAQIQALEKEKADIRAKLAQEPMKLDERINKLQALPMSPIASGSGDFEAPF